MGRKEQKSSDQRWRPGAQRGHLGIQFCEVVAVHHLATVWVDLVQLVIKPDVSEDVALYHLELVQPAQRMSSLVPHLAHNENGTCYLVASCLLATGAGIRTVVTTFVLPSGRISQTSSALSTTEPYAIT